MKIVIEATDKLTELDGVPVRLWEGVTDRGVPCKVFVHRIAVHDSEDQTAFRQELQEKLPPLSKPIALQLLLT